MLTPELGDEDFCYLTTTGRVTRRAHEIEIWFARSADGRTLYLLAGGGERSDWVRNLLVDPQATVRVGDRTYAAAGRVVTGDEADVARDLVVTKYQPGYGSDLSDWRARALPVALDLDASG